MKSKLLLLGWTAALLTSTAVIPLVAQAAQLPNCSGLAAALLTNNDISGATSAIVPAAGGHPSYCHANFFVSTLSGPEDGYLPGQKQHVQVDIGLPLSAADGGSGGTQGNWNGRIQDIGGGGFAGSLCSGGTPVTDSTDSGYVGSNTDTGHTGNGGSGAFALNPDNSLNWGLIRDFAFNGIHLQAVWSKNLTKMYYGMGPKYTYWNGCSTGGRQGHQQAQKYPDDYDGILAGASAFNWDRFIPAEVWPQVVMNQEVGAPIADAKLTAVKQASIAACDVQDGIGDSVLQDPRTCRYDAKSFVCKASGPANCLTPAEAGAVNKIWDGVHRSGVGLPFWFGLERGTSLQGFPGFGLAGSVAFPIATDWLKYWVFQNPSFDWHTLTEDSFLQAFKQSEIKFHDVIGTDDPDLSDFRKHGAKMITYHGLADIVIFPRGTYNYYNRVTEREGGLKNVQKFYRFFPYPGNGHCGGNIDQPNAPLIDLSNKGALFQALVNWVEHGVAPDSIVAYNNPNPALATVSRPICKYPDKLVFKGGSTSVAANFTCQQQPNDDFFTSDLALPDLGANNGVGQLQTLNK